MDGLNYLFLYLLVLFCYSDSKLGPAEVWTSRQALAGPVPENACY